MEEKLKEIALIARTKAYAPYSNYQVGAALRTQSGTRTASCNVENVSNGATVCAERGAIQAAIASEGPGILIEELVVCTSSSPPVAPCGICRQVIQEFASPKLEVHLVNPQGDLRSFPFKDLFPEGFLKSELLEKPI